MKNELKMSPKYIVKRGHYLYFFCYWIYGLYNDFKIAGISLSKTIFNKNENAYPVQSITYPYLNELLKYIQLDTNDVFVDVGCAWGRLIGQLNKKIKLKKIIGVELNKDAANIAKKAFEDYENIEIIVGDIIDKLPTQATVFYLFNPLSSQTSNAFVKKIESEYKKTIRVFYFHPVYRELFDNDEHWQLLNEVEVFPKHSGLGGILLCEYLFNPIIKKQH